MGTIQTLIQCNIKDCVQEFRAFAAFNSHVYRHHRRDIGLEGAETYFNTDEPPTEDTFVSNSQPVDDQQSYNECHSTSLEDLHHSISLLLGTDHYEQQRDSAKFLLKLREVNCVSQKTLLDVLSANQRLFDQTVGRVKAVVTERLNEAGIDYTNVHGLESAISELSSPYEGLETIHKQDKYFVDHFSYLVRARIYSIQLQRHLMAPAYSLSHSYISDYTHTHTHT